MSRETIADVITSILNTVVEKVAQVTYTTYTNIIGIIMKILVREGFKDRVRKHLESNQSFLVSIIDNKESGIGIHMIVIDNKEFKIYKKILENKESRIGICMIVIDNRELKIYNKNSR